MYGLEFARNSDEGWFSAPKLFSGNQFRDIALGKALSQHMCAASPTTDHFFSIMLLTVYSWKTLFPVGGCVSGWVTHSEWSVEDCRWRQWAWRWRWWSRIILPSDLPCPWLEAAPGTGPGSPCPCRAQPCAGYLENTHTNSDIRVAMMHLKQRKIRFLLWRNATKWP